MGFLGDYVHSISSGNIRMIVDGEVTQMFMLMETDMSELDLPPMVMELFMEVDGTSVTDMRIAIDGEDFSDLFPQDMMEEMFDDLLDSAINMPELDMEAFLSAEVEEVDGNTVISMVLDGEAMGAFVAASMEEQLAMMGDIPGLEMEFSFEDIIVSIVADAAGTPLSMTMEMEMRIGFGDDLDPDLAELEGEEMFIRSVTVYTFNGFGDSVEI